MIYLNFMVFCPKKGSAKVQINIIQPTFCLKNQTEVFQINFIDGNV